MADELEFRIVGGHTPATIPMERLAEYLAEWAQLLGEQPYVHFHSLIRGSAVLKAKVDPPARPKVLARVQEIRSGAGPSDARRAFGRLDEMLRADNATATLVAGPLVIPFPGSSRPLEVAFGPIRQDGTVDGEIIRVGGKDETVPVHLREGDTIHTHLHAPPALAREIAKHLFGPTIRARGVGSSYRTGDGVWELRSFRIVSFELLDDSTLTEVVTALRAVPGSGWGDVADPVQELQVLRHGNGG